MADPDISRGIILASSSPARQRLLKDASIDFTVVPSTVDERVVRDTLTSGGQTVDPSDMAEVLARAKAEEVSARYPGSVVIGADQVLACGDEVFNKPDTIEAARETLLKLRGRTHQLHSAVVIAEDGETEWAYIDTAHLTMRSFSFPFLGWYMVEADDKVLQSVGAYQLEGPGIQLFEKIEGDFFTILGLPLLPLLTELRSRKVIPE